MCGLFLSIKKWMHHNKDYIIDWIDEYLDFHLGQQVNA